MDLLHFARVGNYKRFWENLKDVGKQTGKSPAFLFVDTALSTVICGSGMQDYLNYRFYEKSFKERKTYVTIGYQAKMGEYVASIKYAPFFSVKPNFHKNFAKYTKRDWYEPGLGYEKYEEFLDRHEVFICKPEIGLGGTDIRKIKTAEITDRKAFFEELTAQQAFLEELIVQDKEWAKLCPMSVNTLRVMTTAVKGKSKIICVVARIGNGSVVQDNFHSGGMGMLVDMDKGILTGTAFNKLLEHFECHPTTGVKLDGFPIPYWEDVKKMCLEAALVNDNVNIVGWDVAISENGPVIIEGNRGPGWDIVQILLNKGTKYMLEDLKAEMKAAGCWKKPE